MAIVTNAATSRCAVIGTHADLSCAPLLIASSVVRGAQLGESHGGVCILDFRTGETRYVVDWNTTQIDVEGRGGDRGLRGMTVVGDDVYVLSSEALLVFDRHWQLQQSFRNPYLKHCHEISSYGGRAYIASTGYDALLVFDVASRQFVEGFHLRLDAGRLRLLAFDPRSSGGPPLSNIFHLNSVYRDARGLYFAGLRSAGLLCLRGNQLLRAASLPVGTHNAQPFEDGVVFNDTRASRLCARIAGREVAIAIPANPATVARWTLSDDTKLARPLFGRGLCPLSGRYVAAGSSPSTVTIYDLQAEAIMAQLALSSDVRNAIHGLTIWPFDGVGSCRGTAI